MSIDYTGMHFDASQWATSGETPRFSSLDVPEGTQPSKGICETGMVSPFSLIIGSMILVTKPDESSGINFFIALCLSGRVFGISI